MWGLPGRAMTALQRKVPVSLKLTRGMDLRIRRGFCSKSQEGINQNLKGPSFKAPRHRPTGWDKKILLWSGHFKKAEDIPETVSFEKIHAARGKFRVKLCYIMIILTVLGCIVMIIQGKQAVKRHESLVSRNLEKRAR